MPKALKPRWQGYFADPFVIRHENYFYAYGTGGGGGVAHEGNGFVLPVLRSKDLESWESLGGCLTPLIPGKEELLEAYWAPEVAFHDGLFYLFYSVGGKEGENHQIRLAVSRSPDGPFRDTGQPLIADQPFTIDPEPFCDPADDTWYLFFARDFFSKPCGTGLSVASLSPDFQQLTSPLYDVARACEAWQVFERDRQWYGRRWPEWYTLEGPSVLLHEGTYYCFYSGGNWRKDNYGVSWSTARSPKGPWSPSGRKLLQTTGDLRGPGHCSFFEANGKTHIAFHAWDESWQKRQLYIAELGWEGKEPQIRVHESKK